MRALTADSCASTRGITRAAISSSAHLKSARRGGRCCAPALWPKHCPVLSLRVAPQSHVAALRSRCRRRARLPRAAAATRPFRARETRAAVRRRPVRDARCRARGIQSGPAQGVPRAAAPTRCARRRRGPAMSAARAAGRRAPNADARREPNAENERAERLPRRQEGAEDAPRREPVARGRGGVCADPGRVRHANGPEAARRV